MSVALEHLYQDIKEYKVKLIAGKNGLRNKVRWIHTVESEDIANFLQGKEVVFTTGIGINNNEELLNLIKTTNKKSASGIIVSKGKHIKEINEEVINYCQENEYPLFIVPWDGNIEDMMKILTMKIIESERTYLEVANALKDAIFIPSHQDLYLPILEKVGLKCNWKYIVTTIEIEAKDNSTHKIDEYVYKVFKFVEDDLSYVRNYFFSVYVGQSIIIVFYNKCEEEIDAILKKLHTKLSKNFFDLNFYVGTGKHTNSLEKLYKGYEEAKSVAKINRLLRNKNVHIRYSELGIYKLLLAIENKEAIKEFHDETIGDLEAYDEMNNTDYVELLINYFENNCKVNETASSLYLHRNTVNYKLNKIQEILDLNLYDIGDKSKIYLSLMIRYLI